MGRTDKRLKDRELLLLVAATAGGTLGGRTIAQKLSYFGGRKLEQPTGHTAYYFGPYSDEITAALQLSVLAQDFTEQIEQIPDWFGGPDATKHVYTLTEKGGCEAERVAKENPEAARELSDTIRTIGEAIPEFRQKTLSAAAKIDLIISEQNRAVPLEEIRDLAKELGWRLTDREVTEALDVLTRLDLVEVTG